MNDSPDYIHLSFAYISPLYIPYGTLWVSMYVFIANDDSIVHFELQFFLTCRKLGKAWQKICPGDSESFPDCYDLHFYLGRADVYLMYVALAVQIIVWYQVLVVFDQRAGEFEHPCTVSALAIAGDPSVHPFI